MSSFLPHLIVPDRLVDRTDHAPAVANRGERRKTRGIVLHRITDAEEKGFPYSSSDQVERVIEFWLTHPWGVGTTTISEAADRIDHVRLWQRRGSVPLSAQANSFVPYHALIAPDGKVHQMLPWEKRGAHAYPNSKLVGVGTIGDFRSAEPTPEQVLSAKYLVRDLLIRYSCEPVVMTHDQAKAKWGKSERARKPKGCPGNLFPTVEISEWARDAAGAVMKADRF